MKHNLCDVCLEPALQSFISKDKPLDRYLPVREEKYPYAEIKNYKKCEQDKFEVSISVDVVRISTNNSSHLCKKCLIDKISKFIDCLT